MALRSRLWTLALVTTWWPIAAHTGDGVLEINDACARGAGCFAGDGPGYPVFIGAPGSYVLTSSLFPNGANGIEITAGTRIVNIDMNGFRIDGNNQAGQGGGIIGGNGASAISIRDGTIFNMAGDGINIGGSAVIESVHVLGNGGDGIDVNQTSMVRDCRAVGNGGFGVNFSGPTSLYSGMVFSGNGAGSVNLGRTAGHNYCDDERCSRWGRRRYYLTQNSVPGGQALQACAEGFHMAALSEILDPSNLRYDPHLGRTADDSGRGSPAGGAARGWIRNGLPFAGLPTDPMIAGVPNCIGWSSSRTIDVGTAAYLLFDWRQTSAIFGGEFLPNSFVLHEEAATSAIAPYVGQTLNCDAQEYVWCVED